MLQANCQSISRRNALKAAVALTTAAVPVVAVAAGCVYDPIYPLIEKHRRVAALLKEAHRAVAELEATLPEELQNCWPGVDLKMTVEYQGAPFPLAVRTDRDVEGMLRICREHGWSEEELAKGRRALRKEVADQKADWQARVDATGLTRLRDERCELGDAEWDAATALRTTIPTTTPGAVALARYVIDCHEACADPMDVGVCTDEDHWAELLKTIIATLVAS